MGSTVNRVLVVANRTATTPRLLEEVCRRAEASPCEFTLLIPDATDRGQADTTLEAALPLLSKAARRPVAGRVGGPEPFDAIRDEVSEGGYDTIIISALPRQVSQWLRGDLVRRVETLGLPVTPIVPSQASVLEVQPERPPWRPAAQPWAP